ncbi:putative HTH transcriptional regulator [Duganella sp. SG902]|uniref:hypothetical protein n=1 Tax=Duganella sp. SG902 TaxID=2587016 RepID=UPI00159D2E87|nr:hypothetical protein [Duganella sp. SG902]NVM76009.1 putative HTH transcriptional regulator [Duganella sp. SG902]
MTIKIEMRALGDAFTALSEQVKRNGKGGDFGSVLKHAETRQSDTAAELEKYLKMSPEERVALAMRKQLGISEEEYAAMTPDEKKAVDAQIAELIKQKMNEAIAKQQAQAAGLKSGVAF